MASARLVLPVLFGPQTTAISAGRLSVCSAAPYARNPLTVSDLSLGAVKACPHLLETRKQGCPNRLERVGTADAFMRLHQLLRQRVGLQMLEEAVSVALGLQNAWFGLVCHVAFHSTDSASARLRTLCTPSACVLLIGPVSKQGDQFLDRFQRLASLTRSRSTLLMFVCCCAATAKNRCNITLVLMLQPETAFRQMVRPTR